MREKTLRSRFDDRREENINDIYEHTDRILNRRTARTFPRRLDERTSHANGRQGLRTKIPSLPTRSLGPEADDKRATRFVKSFQRSGQVNRGNFSIRAENRSRCEPDSIYGFNLPHLRGRHSIPTSSGIRKLPTRSRPHAMHILSRDTLPVATEADTFSASRLITSLVDTEPENSHRN